MNRIVTAILLAALAAPAAAQLEAEPPPAGAIVEAVSFEPEPVPDSIRALLEVRVGEPFSQDALGASIKNIFRLQIYSDVRVLWARHGEGIELKFQLEEIPVVEGVTVSGGGPVSRSEVIRVARLDREYRLTDERADQIVSRLLDLYRQRGYFAARVNLYSMVNLATGGLRLEISLDPGAPTIVGSFRVGGFPHFSGEQIGSALEHTRVDGIFLEGSFREDLHSIYDFYFRQGYLTADISGVETYYDEQTNLMHIELEINAGPLVRVNFNPAESAEADRWLSLVEFQDRNVPLDRIVANGRVRMLRQLQSEGYVDAVVDSELSVDPAEGAVVVSFDVARHRNYSVGSYEIEGLDPELVALMRPLLALSKKGWFSSPRFSSEAFDGDAQRAVQFLVDRGFRQARVVEQHVQFDDAGQTADLLLRISAGPPDTIERVVFNGNRQVEDNQLRRASELEPGQLLTGQTLNEALKRLREHYDELGFAEARVSVRTDTDPGSVRFDIVEGERSSVSRLIIAGNRTTREAVIRDALLLGEGDPFSRNLINESRRALYRLGLFKRVTIGGVEDELTETDRRLLVRVDEAPPYSVLYGFGVDTEEKLRFSFGASNTNVAGRNIEVGFGARVSQLQQRYQFSVRGPELLFGTLDSIFSLFYEEVSQEGFNARRKGLLFESTGYRLGGWVLTGRYQYKWVDLFDIEPGVYIDRFDQQVTLSLLSAVFTRDLRDDPIDSTSGSFTNLILQYSPTWLGSQAGYLKGQFQMFSFRRVFAGAVLATAVRVGLAWPFDSERDVPISERFFAGGITTLRGFGLNRVGPTEPQLIDGRIEYVPIGGDAMLIANVELRFPLLSEIGGVIFYDVGNVYPRVGDISLTDLTHSLGVGLRLGTPLGPLRLDYGKSLFTTDHNYIFSFGHAF